MARILALVVTLAAIALVAYVFWRASRIRGDVRLVNELAAKDPDALKHYVEQNARMHNRIPQGLIDEFVKRKAKGDADDETIARFTEIGEKLLSRSDAFDMGEEYELLRQLVDEQKSEQKVGK